MMPPAKRAAWLAWVIVAQAVLFGSCAQPVQKSTPFYDVRDFGAVADGKTKSTEAIRKAIEAAAAKGGGTIFFPAGQYLTGPIHLKSNITLHLDAGAIVKFSQDFDDYLPMVRVRWEGTEVKTFSPLIYAVGVEHIAIAGRGVLDGQGEPWWKLWRSLRQERDKTGAWKTDSKWQAEFFRLNKDLQMPDDPQRLKSGFLRPPLIQFLDSRNISIRDVTLKNSPFWTINPAYCDDLTVSGVTIENPDEAPNTDGINPDSCRNVRISDSHISVGDDCITIKSGRDQEGRRLNRPAENYVITNCTMLRGHGGVVIGSEMSGGVKKIAISNCIFDGTDRGIRLKSTRGRGAVIEDVRVSNIVMKDIREEAITLNLFYTKAPPEPFSERTPRFKNIHLSAISARAEQAATLLGLPEAPLEDISLTDMEIFAKHGITIKDAKNIRLRSVYVATSKGPALTAERTERLSLFDVGSLSPHANTPAIALVDVNGGYVRGPLAGTTGDVFLDVRGARSSNLVVEGGFGSVKTPIVIAKDLPERVVTVAKSSASAPIVARCAEGSPLCAALSPAAN